MIALEDVYVKENLQFNKDILHMLLRQRKPWQNISHKELPSCEEHSNFVDSEPYKHWYIIKGNNKPIGAIYLTNSNEIGLFIFETWQGNGYGKAALNELFRLHIKMKEFKANISPNNSRSIAFFANQGFKYHSQLLDENKQNIIQYTYVKVNPYYVAE